MPVIRPRWAPKDMVTAPELPRAQPRRAPLERFALLLNPFYPKDPQASFGKHVLTPTLALTSIAAATPAHWNVKYWDENLLQGPPPCDPLPAVVGITVHLTFARRAYELAAWYRTQGCIVILGGLHSLSRPDEMLANADAVAVGDSVQLWGAILEDIERGELKRVCRADSKRPCSHRSIWRRQPANRNAVPGYLAMSYLYKRSNLFWHLLIRHRLTSRVWRPLIEHSRRRHLAYRKRLEALAPGEQAEVRAASCVSAGV